MSISRFLTVLCASAAILLSLTVATPTAEAADTFPTGYFYIRSVASGLVVKIQNNSTAEGAPAIVWNHKSKRNDSELWKYDTGFLVNKKSGLVLEVPGYEKGGKIEPGAPVAQACKRQRPESLNQVWAYNYQMLMPYDLDVSLSARNGVFTPGAKVVVDTTQPGDPKQQWTLDKA